MSPLDEQLIGEEEGRSRAVYQDTRKLWTIGIGCLVDPSIPEAGLCDEAISVQFTHDSANARYLAAQFPYFTELNDVRRAVLISMVFQLGMKPLHWPNFMAALGARDYPRTAAAGLDSDWARIQTPKRAKRAMQMMSSGQWVNHT